MEDRSPARDGAKLQRSPRRTSPNKQRNADSSKTRSPTRAKVPMKRTRTPPKMNRTKEPPCWEKDKWPSAPGQKLKQLEDIFPKTTTRSAPCICECCPHPPGCEQGRNSLLDDPYSDLSLQYQQDHLFADATIERPPCICECCPHPSLGWQTGVGLAKGAGFGFPISNVRGDSRRSSES